MIPADGEFYAYYYKTSTGGWPVAAPGVAEGRRRRVLAWNSEGRPMVLGEKSLVPADSIEGFALQVVQEGPDAPEFPAREQASPAQTTLMDRRSWYMSQETAQALAEVVDELHHSLRMPKHMVLSELVAVAVEHRLEAEWRLTRKGEESSSA